MKIFERNFALKDWNVVCVGLEKRWITIDKVVIFCKEDKILCSEDQLTGAYVLADSYNEEESTNELKQNMNIDTENINIEEDCYLFWAIEFLMEIIASDDSKMSKLDKVSFLYMDFNYPQSWSNFIYYMPVREGFPSGIDALYTNMITYIENSIRHLLDRGILLNK